MGLVRYGYPNISGPVATPLAYDAQGHSFATAAMTPMMARVVSAPSVRTAGPQVTSFLMSARDVETVGVVIQLAQVCERSRVDGSCGIVAANGE